MRGVLEEGDGEVGGRMPRCSFGVDERGGGARRHSRFWRQGALGDKERGRD